MNGVDRFRAKVTVALPEAILVNELVAAAGYAVVQTARAGHKELTCVGAMLKAARLNPETFRRVWPVIVELSAGGPIHSRIVSSLAYVERRLAGTGVSLSQPFWRERLLKLGAREIVDATASLASLENRSGETVWGEAVRKILNRGLRTNKMVFPGKARGDNPGDDPDPGDDEPDGGERTTPARRDTPPGPSATPDPPAPLAGDRMEVMANCGSDRLPPGSECRTCRKPMRQEPTYFIKAGATVPPGTLPVTCANCHRAATRAGTGDGRHKRTA